ncbi:MAG: hypothetical protein KatS3mg110_2590 [Pirellulaceae bacterium]|nr:MAG: hypothetical protein KatS3mg110_2590 [Pirellulaceae bacterium]
MRRLLIEWKSEGQLGRPEPAERREHAPRNVYEGTLRIPFLTFNLKAEYVGTTSSPFMIICVLGATTIMRIAGHTGRRVGGVLSGTAALLGVLLFVFLLVPCTAIDAQSADEDELLYLPGVVLEQLDPSGAVAARVVPQISWHAQWPVPPPQGSQLRLRWHGLLMSELEGPYRLHIYTNQAVQVVLDRRIILETEAGSPSWHSSPPVELSFGWYPLEVTMSVSRSDAELGVYWSGPHFGLEPLGDRNLMHEPAQLEARRWERGRLLARALRCEACHGDAPSELPKAPSLAHLSGNIYPQWIIEWLAAEPVRPMSHSEDASPTVQHPADSLDTLVTPSGSLDDYRGRRMPHFRLSAEDAAALAVYLTDAVQPQADQPGTSKEDEEQGRQLFLSVGCLACHGLKDFGDTGLFGGSDLTEIARKRPATFFSGWLAEPERFNPQHRMPVFRLSVDERRQLAAFLSRQGEPAGGRSDRLDPALRERGKRLFVELRCSACHQGPDDAGSAKALPALSGDSRWDRSCAGTPSQAGQPAYGLGDSDQRALRSYFVTNTPARRLLAEADRVTDLLRENNCVQCHLRGSVLGLSGRTAAVLEAFPELAPHTAALLPPALNAVGDKLRDEALRKAIRAQEPRREWLLVRMPQYRLSDTELDELANALIQADRIPDAAPASPVPIDEPVPEAVAARLVTPDGFGCTSCHSVGNRRAPNAPIHTLGPNLAQLGQRIRRPWFERWVRNPARIVPRIEMPAIQTPVPGVLDDQLDRQLAAIWNVLNRREFRPPEPNPVRVVRKANLPDLGERSTIITDVIQADGQRFVQALLIALPNRHNVLLDLGEVRLAGWWIGDAARQRTLGKTWFWEAGSSSHVVPGDPRPAWTLRHAGRSFEPQRQGQFLTWFDSVEHVDHGVLVRYRLVFPSAMGQSPHVVRIEERFLPVWEGAAGFERLVRVSSIPPDTELVFRPWQGTVRTAATQQANPPVRWQIDERGAVWYDSPTAGARWLPDGSLVLSPSGESLVVRLRYQARLPVDQFAPQPTAIRARSPQPLPVVPGFRAVRLPFTDELMPTGLAWDNQGRLLVTSLKGRLWRASDDNQDGWEDRVEPISDELAAPYGVAVRGDQIVVINKYALLGLSDLDGDGQLDRMETWAAGWGHTDDYHDWAVGLPEDGAGGYYIALPCQQDDRPIEATRYRGMTLHVVPADEDSSTGWPFRLEPMSAGHRFPMGLARNRQGWLFATDNQGNYNPFNELNHIVPGAHFGFINAWEKRAGIPAPPMTPAAINIPHPWTRSVNGICFLETPAGWAGPARAFGPFEGHLVGCEYDTRRLIRMTLDPVGDVLQGAAYPLSLDQPGEGPTFLGPVVCAVSPQAHLYIGSLRDSGWGGANNVGEVVRMVPDWEQLPVGIQQVRSVADGFELTFTGAVDVAKASEPDSYAVSSYRRIATPAYGGPDVDRRRERIAAVRVSRDSRRVHLQFDQLRPGFVYEFHLKNLAADPKARFFPAEAYYSLHVPGPAVGW